jgi:dsDNA-specific endonuclease/ATPase MutS2
VVTFTVGDRVHLAGIGTGTVREARGGGRYLVDIKGRAVIAAAADLEHAHPPSKPRPQPHPAAPGCTQPHPPAPGRTPPSLDLHGKTVAEAVAEVELFVNDALLDGHGEVRVIHGRGRGRVKAAVHHYFRQLPAVASCRLDPANPGVTIVTFA